MALSEAAGAAGAALLADPEPAARLAAAMALVGASVGLWVPGYDKLVAEACGYERASEAYAAASAYRSLVSAPAPYLGGLAYEALGPLAVFASSSALMAAAGALAAAVPRSGPSAIYKRAAEG